MMLGVLDQKEMTFFDFGETTEQNSCFMLSIMGGSMKKSYDSSIKK